MTDVVESAAVDSVAKKIRVEQDLALLGGDVQSENYGVDDDRRFMVESEFQPSGAQPAAISALADGVEEGQRFQTLLGITGSGKSATIAWTIEQVQRPTLILAPNKSLAAQLAQEMREFFPNNRVEYFVSYYDYYQPEAYIPSSVTRIHREGRVRSTRKSTVCGSAATSCACSAGVTPSLSPQCFVHLRAGLTLTSTVQWSSRIATGLLALSTTMRSILRRLVRYAVRPEATLHSRAWPLPGAVVTPSRSGPAYEANVASRIEMSGETPSSRIATTDPVTGENVAASLDRDLRVFPATHFATSAERLQTAAVGARFEAELEVRLAESEEVKGSCSRRSGCQAAHVSLTLRC